MLVLADAHLPRAVAGALWAGCCAGAGQARGSVERIYVVRERYEPFLAGLVRAAERLRVGDPADDRTQVGPLASAGRLARVQELVEEAVAAGARLHCGGPVEGPLATAGAFYAPAVLSGVAPDAKIEREPVDGPGALRARGRLRGRGDRAGQRQRLRARRLGLDGRPLPRHAHRARAARRDGLAQRPPARADGLARPVGRGRGRRPRAHARRGRAARVRAGEADHVGPASHPRSVVGAVRRHDQPRRGAPSRGCAPAARSTASAPGAPASCRSRGWSRARSGAGCRASRRHRRRGDQPLPGARGRPTTLQTCPPRPTQARSASASSARGSATRAACRGCSTPRSTSPA